MVINDPFARQDALQCKSQVTTPVNDEIEFRLSFEESNDEDYTIICDQNMFSYKMIFLNNLKTDSENDNEKARVPSFPPPKLTTSYIDDLDFFNDLENEFLTIVYNDAQTSKSDLLIEPILSPQHIDEFNLNDETSVFEYDEEEQNILYYNDIFPFNITRIVDLKSDENNNDNDIDIIQSSKGNEITHRSNVLMDTSSDKIDKISNEESFVLELNVNIVTWIYLFNKMLLRFIMNFYVPFGIPFDPKQYYKDGDCAIMLRRPSRSLGLSACASLESKNQAISAIEMLWEWRGIANLAFIQLGWVSRVDEMILARVSSGFAGEKVWEDIQVVPGFVGREMRLLGK
ncbi:hypothetical protein Tco_0824875 [Tanacetum coccineum]